MTEVPNYAEMPVDVLEEAVGRYLMQGELGMRRPDAATLRRAARRWFASLREELAENICGNESLRKVWFGPRQKDRNFLMMAIGDAVAAIHGIPVPVGALAAMVLHYGIDSLCPEWQDTKRGE